MSGTQRADLTVVEVEAGKNREETGTGETFSTDINGQVRRVMMCYCTEESL